MAAIITASVQAATEANYDRAAELKPFDDTKAGVKGLVDSGIAWVPRMFHQPPGDSSKVINHGLPASVLVEMIKGVCRFYEQDSKLKKQRYTRGNTKPLVYNSNFDLYTASAANWRDTFYFSMAPKSPNPEELPEPCRDILLEYSKQVMKLGCSMFKLFSKAFGLEPNHLEEMGCAVGLAVLCHYHPACPQPELTIGVIWF